MAAISNHMFFTRHLLPVLNSSKLFRLLLLLLLSSLPQKISSLESLNEIIDCRQKCDLKRELCPKWIQQKTCLLMNGKFIPKSLKECLCCPKCHIKRDLHESCFQVIPGFDVTCSPNLFCSKKFGFICISREEQQKWPKFETKGRKWRKSEVAVSRSLTRLIPESQRVLKRVPRAPFRFKIGFGGKNATKGGKESALGSILDPIGGNGGDSHHTLQSVDNISIPSAAPTSINLDASGAASEPEKLYNMISGGNANSINRNIGATYIINNNYRFASAPKDGKPFAQNIYLPNDNQRINFDHKNHKEDKVDKEAPSGVSSTTTTTTTAATSSIETTAMTTTKEPIRLEELLPTQ